MKVVVFILVILFSQNKNVSCFNFINFVSEKFNEVASAFSDAYKTLKNTVYNFFIDRVVETRYVLKNDKDPVDDNEDIHDIIKRTGNSDWGQSEQVEFRCEPTSVMSTPQLAMSHGRTIESHIIHTKDGYLLTLHRILTTPVTFDQSTTNKTVILHHGLLGSSADWILLGNKKSLPYLLSNAGYDVWMVNARGNYYSRGHMSKDLNSLEFWDFSWQEMGEHDLPAAIDYIKSLKNKNEAINFIGHSMGGTSLLVLLSTAPHYNQYLRIGILLAPLAYMSKVKGPLKVLMTLSSNPMKHLVTFIGSKEFVPQRKIPDWLARVYCTGPMLYCSNPLLFLCGSPPHIDIWNASFVAKLLYYVPGGGSTNTIFHYAQMTKTGKFHKFGNASDEFPLKKINLPIAIISSGGDRLATMPDILKLYNDIANPIDHHIVRERNLTHTEFVWGYDADTLVFSKVLEYLESDLNDNNLNSNEVI